MRTVKIVVGKTPIGEQRTWAYPAGQSLGLFVVPVYPCLVSGTDGAGKAIKQQFESSDLESKAKMERRQRSSVWRSTRHTSSKPGCHITVCTAHYLLKTGRGRFMGIF